MLARRWPRRRRATGSAPAVAILVALADRVRRSTASSRAAARSSPRRSPRGEVTPETDTRLRFVRRLLYAVILAARHRDRAVAVRRRQRARRQPARLRRDRRRDHRLRRAPDAGQLRRRDHARDHAAAAGRRLGARSRTTTASSRTCGSTTRSCARAADAADRDPEREARRGDPAQRHARRRRGRRSTSSIWLPPGGRRRARASTSLRGGDRADVDDRRGHAGGRAARGRRRAGARRPSAPRARPSCALRCLARLRADGLLARWQGFAARRRSRPALHSTVRAVTGASHEPLATQQATPPAAARLATRPSSPCMVVRDRSSALAGLAAVGYVVSIAASAPPLVSLKPQRARAQPEVLAADGTPPRLHPGRRAAPARRAATEIPKVAQGRHGRDRGRALLQAQGRRLRGRRPRRGQEPHVSQQDRAGRLDDHDAARPQPLHRRASATYQRKIREAKLAEELEDEHSKDWILDKYLNTVPVRHGRRPDRDRRPGRRARLLQQARRGAHAARGRAARRPAAGAVATTRRSRTPEAAKARRNEVLRKMAELGMITPRARRRRRCDAALGLKPSRYFTRRREQLLLRLRQGRADQGVRRRRPCARAA